VPPLPQTERGAFCHIATDAPGERVLYCHGTNVIWRSIAPLVEGPAAERPDDVFCWKGHTKKTTCAAMSPNSQWVVSGDAGGAVRVWGAKGDHVLKNEYKLWNGEVKDASWSSDSTRIVAAGDGNEMKATAMIWDTGSKTGEVTGHIKKVNSISFRSQRPFRIATGGDDMLVAFHEGPPFKFKKSHTVHTNFVNIVRFSPDGEWFISAGGDSKLCLYTGKEGELAKEFAKPDGISGSIWAAAWAPDSARVVTAGGDRKLRVWDREAGAQVFEARVADGALADMQVGVAWASAARIISVCLDGRLLLWDVAPEGSLALAAVVDGTQGPLSCLSCDTKTGVLVRGGSDGAVAITAPDQPDRHVNIGKTINHVLAHSPAYGGPPEALVIAVDNTVHRLAHETGEALAAVVEVKEPVKGAGWLDPEETRLVIATGKGSLHCVAAGGIEWSQEGVFPREPTALASSPGKPGMLAVAMTRQEGSVGGVQCSKFDIATFAVEDPALPGGVVPGAVLTEHVHEVCALRFSPSGEFLASADAGGKIHVWKFAAGSATLLDLSWCNHTARVNSLDWLPDSRHVVSGSLDRHVFVWDVDAPSSRVEVKEAHKGGAMAVAGCGPGTFASVGHDGFLLVHQLD